MDPFTLLAHWRQLVRALLQLILLPTAMQILFFLSFLLVLMCGQWLFADVVVTTPLTNHHASHRHEVPGINPRSHPGKSDITTDPVHCQTCGAPTPHTNIRHVAWWSGNATDVRWMQTVRQCKVCEQFSVHQEEKLGEKVFGEPYQLIHPLSSASSGWVMRDVASLTNLPEDNPRTQTPVRGGLSCPVCLSNRLGALHNGEMRLERRTSWVPFLSSEQDWQFVQCGMCKHGMLVVRTRHIVDVFGIPLSRWTLAVAEGLWTWWYVIAPSRRVVVGRALV